MARSCLQEVPAGRTDQAVLLIDDHPAIHVVLRELISRLLPNSTVRSEYRLGAAILCAEGAHFDLAILDLYLPDVSGLQSLERLRAAIPSVPIVVFSVIEDQRVAQAAIAKGAKGYIPKTAKISVVRAALELVLAGGRYMPVDPFSVETRSLPTELRTVPDSLTEVLTQRQLDVLLLLVEGFSNKEIAKQLGIAENTVKRHMSELFDGLKVSSRTEAIVVALRLGIKLQ